MKNEETLLSIIIPVYNVEKYLSRCVDSIMCQDLKDVQIILVDDGSTDDSRYICDKYAQKSEKISVVHKSNGGVSSARNSGLDIVEGTFVTFLDSDDWVENTYIETLRRALNDQDLLVFSYYIQYEELTKIDEYKLELCEYSKPQKALLQLEKSGMLNVLWNKVYKRELIEKAPKIRFEIDLEPGEDLLFNSAYFKRVKSVTHFDKMLYHYMRQGEDTLANKYRPDLVRKNRCFIQCRKELYSYFEMYSQLEQQVLAKGNLCYLIACIPNMYRQGVEWASNLRLEFYKDSLKSEEIKHWVKLMDKSVDMQFTLKLFCTLYKFGSAHCMELVYSLLLGVRNKFKGTYIRISKRIKI